MSKSTRMPDAHVRCPRCDGEGGAHGRTGGYIVSGSGYGDASPREGYCPCDLCDGVGHVHVDKLEDHDWRRLG